MAEAFTIPLHIIPKDGKTHDLRAVAAGLEELNTGDCLENYTVPQAFAILITSAPHRLAEFASGWYFDNHPLLEVVDPVEAAIEAHEAQADAAADQRMERARDEARGI